MKDKLKAFYESHRAVCNMVAAALLICLMGYMFGFFIGYQF